MSNQILYLKSKGESEDLTVVYTNPGGDDWFTFILELEPEQPRVNITWPEVGVVLACPTEERP